ncbi:hypothetical protein ES703_120533 [subsurface metagenome]
MAYLQGRLALVHEGLPILDESSPNTGSNQYDQHRFLPLSFTVAVFTQSDYRAVVMDIDRHSERIADPVLDAVVGHPLCTGILQEPALLNIYNPGGAYADTDDLLLLYA